MKIMGLDLSTKKTGAALIEDGKLIEHKLLDYHKISDGDVRLDTMLEALDELVHEWNPDHICVEDTWVGFNPDVAKTLSYLVGGIRMLCVQNKILFSKMIPSKWRNIIGIASGRGVDRQQLKLESMNYVCIHYAITVGDDEADAINIATAKWLSVSAEELF